jgi:hypothetical protein
MMRHSNNPNITRKKALHVISFYLKLVPKKIKKQILYDMMDMGLLEEVDRYKIKIINHEKSDTIPQFYLFEPTQPAESQWWK